MEIKPAHTILGMFDQPITLDIWRDKYSYGSEQTPFDSMARVCEGIYHNDFEHKNEALQYMRAGLWCPAGRIHAGAGTPKIVTLVNCYVSRTIGDSMPDIGDALKEAMLTMQQGGGIGMDFSTLRPSGALLQRTGSEASGPLPFMSMWNSMCETIMSAGSRRGAMMATMRCDHPDLIKFIEAKHTKGILTNFNVSVLVTDAFMDAVVNDEMWHLGFHEPPAKGNHLFVVERDDGSDWYAYSEYRARELWSKIIKSTYEFAEPGVIFIDRVNDENNLKYVEDIACTNPCGEQPLPPHGACNLGAVNLARMVRNPFYRSAEFDFDLLTRTTEVGVRFLDNVIDATHYPLGEQHIEQELKRRIGLGVTGLANAMAMLGYTYGSQESIWFVNKVMSALKNSAYAASARLAKERGAFPTYEKEHYCNNNTKVLASLDDGVKDLISAYGLRNGVLLTIAPTGTTSIYYGNVSSGIEPVFMHEMRRNVRQPDNSMKSYRVMDYGVALWRKINLDKPLPSYMVTTADVSVEEHLKVQAACQAHVDSSISKTINCPKDMDFGEFKEVYFNAYELGCKGCTTYRPSDVRGAVLEDPDAKTPEVLVERPEKLTGVTYKIRWPSVAAAFYITINELDGEPFEVFISSKNQKYTEWTAALSILITSLMRQGVNIEFIPEELKSIVSATDAAWVNKKFYGSLVALIGDTIGQHLKDRSMEGASDTDTLEIGPEGRGELTGVITNQSAMRTCDKCLAPAVVMIEGCETCTNCGYSQCG